MRKSSLAAALVCALGFGCSDEPEAPDAGGNVPPRDAAADASVDAGVDSGVDAGVDAGIDAGSPDAGHDGGTNPIGPVNAIRAGRLIDSVNGSVMNDAVIVIENGRVSYVGTDASQIPAGATLLDWTSFTVVPGFIDVHTHFSFMTDDAPGTYPWQYFFRQPPARILALARQAAFKTLRTGVTSAVDKGSFARTAEALKAEIADGTTQGPRLFVAGRGLFQNPFGGFHGADAVRTEVRRKITEENVDLIKIYADGCSDETLTCTFAFTVEEIRAAVEEAHSMNRNVSVHAYHSDGAENVIQAAPDTLEHAEGLSDAQLTTLVANNITYVPTIDHNRYYRDNLRYFGFAPELYPQFTDFIASNLQTATDAHAKGAKIAMGSDAVFSGFGENTRELNYLAQTGMTPLEVLQSATIVGAATINQENQIGQVATGFYADLVALEGDPMTDPTVLVTGVRGVVAAGVAIDLNAAEPPLGPAADPCEPSDIVDLTTVAPGPDGIVRYVGDNSDIREPGTFMPPMSCFLSPPEQAASMGHQIALRYRMHSAGILQVSTANAGTAPGFDSVVLIASACAANAPLLACNDNIDALNAQSIATTRSASIDADTEVFILVGGYLPAAGSLSPTGAFELTLQELPAVAIGDVCDSTEQTNICTASSCVPVQATPYLATCVADGEPGGACRSAAPRCNAALACSAQDGSGWCRAPVAAGDACDPTERRTVCAAGTTCPWSLATLTSGTCTADGAQGGLCRDAAPLCDGTLSCSDSGSCRATVATGAACDRFGRSYVCSTDDACALTSASEGTCGAVTAETVDPNDTPATAQGPFTTASTFGGAISVPADVDCYSITLDAPNAGLVIETNDGHGGCPVGADTIATLYGPDGTTVLFENDDVIPGVFTCSRIDGTLAGPARDLAPGTYSVCVRAYSAADTIDAYVLNVIPVP